MIPVLYESTEVDFSRNGVGLLPDCTECSVTEERNGVYECEFKYPVKGRLYSEITPDRIVKVKANEVSDPQLFRIYSVSKPQSGIVTIDAQHISYDLNMNIVSPMSLKTVNANYALTQILENTYFEHPFTAVSTLSTIGNFEITEPVSARNCFGGMEGSILDHFGGEYEFDNFTVKLHANRGSDNGVSISYGKNLTNIEATTDIQGVYTSIYPYAIDSEGVLYTLPEKVIIIDASSNYGSARTLALDLSEKFEDGETITETKLRNYANAYASDNNINTPDENIKVSFVQLWQSKEYETIALLERVKLCDIVTVKHPILGVSVKTKVIKTIYDSLKEKYVEIELGTARSNFADTLNKVKSDVKTMSDFIKTQPSVMERAIQNATKLITGNSGGYVVLHDSNGDGFPDEILVMDKPTIEEALKVWRWNNSGLGYSSTGYNGDFALAMTIDGAIVADFITTGTLSADLIKTGVLEGVKIIATLGSIAGWKIDGTKLVSSSGDITLDSKGGGGFGSISIGEFLALNQLGLTLFDGSGNQIGGINRGSFGGLGDYGISINLTENAAGFALGVWDEERRAFVTRFEYDSENDNFTFYKDVTISGNVKITGDITDGNIVDGVTTDGYKPATGEFWAIKSMTTDPEGKITNLVTGNVTVKNGLVVSW